MDRKSWTCRSCNSFRAFIDFLDDEPTLRCLECNWLDVLEDNRCAAAVRGGYRNGRRCTLGAYSIGNVCHRHEQRLPGGIRWWLETWPDDIPSPYRMLFEHALENAGVVFRDEHHRQEVARRAVELRVRPETGASLVYFVQRDGLIKIGTTTNLPKRLKAIGKGSSMAPGMTIGPVELLATEPGDRDREYRLHSKFQKTRIHGTEWFRPSKSLLRYIEDLNRYQRDENHYMRRVATA
jgi:hypothetical protein